MLRMKHRCEICGGPTPAESPAWICSYECTYCSACRADLSECPNCGGELQPRPRRTTGGPEIVRRLPGRLGRRVRGRESGDQ